MIDWKVSFFGNNRLHWVGLGQFLREHIVYFVYLWTSGYVAHHDVSGYPLLWVGIARCIAVPDFAIHLWYHKTDILTFVICTMTSSWDMIQRWSRTRLGHKYVNLDTLSPLPGVVDGHNSLSGNLRHVGATAGRGLALASQLSASRDQFIQSMESQQEEMMTMLAQKQKSFWESMKCQMAEQKKTIADIQQRQNDALKELQDQDTGLQMTRQTLSPVPSLRWDYREGALRAQQLLTKQETLGSLHTSTPVEERTHLEHPIEGVPGGVSAGGTSFQEDSASRRTQPWRSVMIHANLIPLTQCTDTPYQEAGLQECHRNASDQMGTGYPFRDAVDPSQYRITRSPHHQEELTELGQDAQSSLRHPMQGVSAGITEPQDSVFQLEAVLQKCHVDRDLQGVSAGTIAPQSPPSSAHHHEEHSGDDLVVCHPEPDMVTGGQTNLRSSTDAIVELESGGTDDPDPVMDSGASVASPTKATSPPEAAKELATHPQSLSKDPTENFTAEQVGDFRPHYQRSPRLLRKENASRQDRKQAKKEFSTQLAGQSGSDDSSGSSSDDHYRRGQRKGRKHQKGSRCPRRTTGTSDASLDRNWRQKDNRHTLKVSKLSSCDYSGRQNGWDFDMDLMLQDTEHVKVTATGSEEFWWDACEDFEEELMDSLKRESCEQVSTTIKDKAIQQESLLAEWYELEKSFDELELTKDDDSREDFRILKVDEEQLFLEWSLIEKALDAESRLERKMGGEEDSGYLVDMNCKIRAIISDAQCRIQDIVTTALKDIHDCQQVDVLTRPRPHVANVDYDCSSIRDITPKVDLSLSKDCSDSAPPIDETARGCTDSLHCSGSAKCDCDVKTSSMTVKVPEGSTELAPSTIVDQGVSDVEYSRARIRLGNFPQDSTELAPGTIVDQGVGDVEDTRISVSWEDSLEDSAYFTHLSTGYSDSDVECQHLNSASTSHSVSDTSDGVTLGWDLAASVELATPSMVADSNGQLQVESSIPKVNLSEPKELGTQSPTIYHRRLPVSHTQLSTSLSLATLWPLDTVGRNELCPVKDSLCKAALSATSNVPEKVSVSCAQDNPQPTVPDSEQLSTHDAGSTKRWRFPGIQMSPYRMPDEFNKKRRRKSCDGHQSHSYSSRRCNTRFSVANNPPQWISQIVIDDWRRKMMGPAVRRQRRPLACWRYSRAKLDALLGGLGFRSKENLDARLQEEPFFVSPESQP